MCGYQKVDRLGIVASYLIKILGKNPQILPLQWLRVCEAQRLALRTDSDPLAL